MDCNFGVCNAFTFCIGSGAFLVAGNTFACGNLFTSGALRGSPSQADAVVLGGGDLTGNPSGSTISSAALGKDRTNIF